MTGATPRPESSRRRVRTSAGRELWFFVGVALVVLVAVATGSVIASEHLARRNALAEAERTTLRIGDVLVRPFIEDYLAGVPGPQEAFDRVVTNRLRDDSLHSLAIWDATGRVVYSSVKELEGQVFEPSEELRAALRGEVVADVDQNPETGYEAGFPGPVVEVYAPVSGVSPPLVLEAYFDHGVIEQQTDLVRGQILPIALGGLVLLQVVQIPIAASLAARVRRHDTERAALIERNLAESERERKSVAADLHDGPVQDLAGVGYALGALRGSVPPERHQTVDRLLEAVHHAVTSLRQVMVDVYPPDLSGEGLPQAVRLLAERLRDQGLEVYVVTEPLPPIASERTAALYRAAKESLANAAHHARASQVWVRLTSLDGAGPHRVRLEVADDGVGFRPDSVGRSPDGHFGLQLMTDRVTDLGGWVELGTRPGGGAMVTVELPVDPAE
jgi:two-component system, NarL family, sensor kinase